MTPAAQLLERAVAMLRPGDELAIATDGQAYPDVFLVAIARPTVACVIRVPRAEYCGFALAQLAGFDLKHPKESNARNPA